MIPARHGEARQARPVGPEVAGELEDADARIAACELAQLLVRVVRRSVVNEQELDPPVELVRHSNEARIQVSDVLRLVEKRDHDGDELVGCRRHGAVFSHAAASVATTRSCSCAVSP